MRKFAVLLGACSLLAQAQTGIELIQPDAGFVFGIEWRKIIDSPIGAMLTEQMHKTALPQAPWTKAFMDVLLHDLDSVLISASATELNKVTAAAPPALVVLKGRFKPELQTLLRSISTKVDKYRTVELLAVPSDAPGAGAATAPNKNRIAFLDAGTVMAGDIAEVRAAIDRLGRPVAARKGILDGIANLAAANDLWIVFDLPANALKEAPPQAAQMFSGVKGAELGISFQQGLGLQLNVRTKDDAAATTVAQALQGLIALGAMSQSQAPQAGEVLRKIRITPENSMVKLALSLDRNELEKMIREAQSGAQAAVNSTANSTAKNTAALAPEPKRTKAIRITGLDSGPIEVAAPKQ